jgi:hypothetical protein
LLSSGIFSLARRDNTSGQKQKAPSFTGSMPELQKGVMSKAMVSHESQFSLESPLSSHRAALSRTNPRMRVERLKRKFLSTQLTFLRAQIYAAMRQSGSSHVYALAEVDRVFREVAASIANASKLATNAAAQAELAERGAAWVEQSSTE